MAESRELEALREGIQSRQVHLRVTEALLADARAQIEAQKALLLDARSALHGYDVTIGAIRADELPVQREEVAHRISDYLFPRDGSAPPPAAVPGLVFGEPDAAVMLLRLLRERVGDMPRHEECLTFNGRPSLTPSDDGDWLKRSDVLAALDPSAHNAARLKGGE